MLPTTGKFNPCPQYSKGKLQYQQGLPESLQPVILHKIQVNFPLKPGHHVFVIDPMYKPVPPTTCLQTNFEQKNTPLPSFSTTFPNNFHDYTYNSSMWPATASENSLDNIVVEEFLTESENESKVKETNPQLTKSDKTTLKNPLACKYCFKELKSKRTLLNHERIHRSEKPFTCGICDKPFRLKTQLKEHLYTHTGERPFKCSVCGKRFRQRGSLHVHKGLHDNSRSFKCPVCGKDVKQKANLKSHMSKHSSIKPHRCSCGKSFKRKWYFKMHLRKKASTEHVAAPEIAL